MCQVLFEEQWIPPEADPEIREVFYARGKRVDLKKGQELRHGAPGGDITLLLAGLGIYRLWDYEGKEHLFSIILPNRVMGDIDALCQNPANMCASIVKSGAGIVLPYKIWYEAITERLDLFERVVRSGLTKQQCHIEALLSCFTLAVDKRLSSFFYALIKAYYKPKPDGWNPLPIQITTVLLAKAVSASRTSVSLALSRWQAEGLLKKDGRFLSIHGKLLANITDW